MVINVEMKMKVKDLISGLKKSGKFSFIDICGHKTCEGDARLTGKARGAVKITCFVSS